MKVEEATRIVREPVTESFGERPDVHDDSPNLHRGWGGLSFQRGKERGVRHIHCGPGEMLSYIAVSWKSMKEGSCQMKQGRH